MAFKIQSVQFHISFLLLMFSLPLSISLGVHGDDEACGLVGVVSAGNDQVFSRLQTVQLNQFPRLCKVADPQKGSILEDRRWESAFWSLHRSEKLHFLSFIDIWTFCDHIAVNLLKRLYEWVFVYLWWYLIRKKKDKNMKLDICISFFFKILTVWTSAFFMDTSLTL